ncbi:MAG: putative ABC transporter ATP-binding protein [Candidatus Methanogaster sp.]|nr:MAG: putative ABC transporter ATP-binding protein [ANME-2 cluster archaeon]
MQNDGGIIVDNILETKGLRKTYILNKKEHNVLNDVDMQIKEGEFISIMGPSGSGKSTLLYNVSGMDKMTTGSVVFKGIELSTLSEKEMSTLRLHKMGFVFQQINLLKNLDIIDNIIISAYMAKDRSHKEINRFAIELMEKTGILELANNDITQASGGQLQRVAICRSLINNPKIIFGDEPTGALNSKSANEIMDMFKVINESGTTIMLVTHDVKVASKTERVLFMIDGKIEGEYNLGKLKEEDKDSSEREEKLSKWLLEMDW